MRERLLLKLHPHNPWLVLLQARPMLDAGDTQELDPGRPQGPWAGWLEGLLEWRGGAWVPHWGVQGACEAGTPGRGDGGGEGRALAGR